MALFGRTRDVNLIKTINRELLGDVITQQASFYKVRLEETTFNLYGEAAGGKFYDGPVIFNCLVERGDQEYPESDLGVDFSWPMTFKFLRDDLLSALDSANQGQGFGTYQQPFIQYGASIQPAAGDVIQYQNGYWEVDNTNTTQFFVGKDPAYPYYDDAGNNPLNDGLENFGYNVGIECVCHYVPSDRVNIILSRM